MKKTKSLFSQLHEANEKIKSLENKNNELIDIVKKLVTDEHIEQSMYNSWINKAKELIGHDNI